MKKFKYILIAALFVFNSFLLFSENAVYQSENYTVNVTYNESLVPGDAIFVRFLLTVPKNAIPKSHKKDKNFEIDVKATLRLYQGEKVIESSDFYDIKKQKNPYSEELLCGIPLSTFLKNDNYSLKVIYCLNNDSLKEFSLPLVYKKVDFYTETIAFDEKNTSIKTDNSPKRVAQIDKLNTILFTSFPTDIYFLQNFSSPTYSTNYTAHFGDRRTYVYSNGKLETSLHYGNDYGIPEGTSVFSCAEGQVVMAEERISTGWSIVIEHLPGLYSLYYHLSEMNVKEGDFVKQGDLIGKSGSTGLATGPHLHWEIRLNGAAVRPEFFLNNFTFEPEISESNSN